MINCGMAEMRPAEKISSKGRELGPRLKALLLAQPLNELEPLQFRELPSKPSKAERESLATYDCL